MNDIRKGILIEEAIEAIEFLQRACTQNIALMWHDLEDENFEAMAQKTRMIKAQADEALETFNALEDEARMEEENNA